MVIKVFCPACRAALGVTEDMIGAKVRCPTCKGAFVAARPSQPETAVAVAPAAAPAAPAPAPMTVGPASIQKEPPRAAAALPTQAYDDDIPRRRARRRDDERAGAGLPVGAIVAICGGGVLVVVVIAVGLWYLLSDTAPAADVVMMEPVAEAAVDMKVAEPPFERGPFDDKRPFDEKRRFDEPPDFAKDIPIMDPPGRPIKEPPVDKKPPVVAPKLPPVVPVALAPAPLKADKEERALPSSAKTLAVGGGGRFVILHLPRERKLAVFDANEAKIVKYLPLGEDDVKFAAGMDRLLVVMPATKVVQRWNLLTLEKEVTAPLPTMDGRIKQVCMGHASNGPLCLISGDERFSGAMIFLDPFTLKRIDYDWAGGIRGGIFDGEARVSGDGSVFAGRRSTLVLQGGSAKVHPGENDTFLCMPSPDARYVYSALSVRSPEGNLLFKPENPGGFITMPFVPAYQPGYFMRVEEYASRDMLKGGFGGPGRKKEGTGNLQFYIAGQTKPFAVWDDFDGVYGQKLTYLDASGMTSDRRYVLLPQNKLLLTIPLSDDKLILHRFDPVKELDKSGVDYLVVLSTSPSAKKGAPYVYPVDARSKKGGLKYNLDSGPEGMKIDAAGKLTWATPADFADRESTVIITISDAAGLETLHTFRLSVLD
ncbi:MAG: MJ0042-type zinc finger domain-containing protein [Gemmataceae bacterium]